MRILVDSGDHRLTDKTRVARIGVAIRRLRRLWPDAEIGLLTDEATQAELYFPGTTAVAYSGGGGWPTGAGVGLLTADEPEYGLDGKPLNTGTPRLGERFDEPQLRTTAVPRGTSEADLVICAGGVDFTDRAAEQVTRSLAVMEAALRAGARVAMFSQSFGPLEHPDLLARAAEVLPHVEVITVRDGIHSPRVLGLVGVPANRISVTGDDILDLAPPDASVVMENELGINVGMDLYEMVAPEQINELSSAIRKVADENASSLVPVYVSEHNDADRLGTLKLIGGYPMVRDDYSRYAHPMDIAERIARCRVLVTGSAGAAALALSQGVPTIGLPRGESDRGGFDSLMAQYPAGCRVVPLGASRLFDELTHEARSLWALSPRLRSDLTVTTVGHIATGEGAYRRLYAAVEGRSPATAAA